MTSPVGIYEIGATSVRLGVSGGLSSTARERERERETHIRLHTKLIYYWYDLPQIQAASTLYLQQISMVAFMFDVCSQAVVRVTMVSIYRHGQEEHNHNYGHCR